MCTVEVRALSHFTRAWGEEPNVASFIMPPKEQRPHMVWVIELRGWLPFSKLCVYSAEASWTDIALSIKGLVAHPLFWCLGDATHLGLAKGVPWKCVKLPLEHCRILSRQVFFKHFTNAPFININVIYDSMNPKLLSWFNLWEFWGCRKLLPNLAVSYRNRKLGGLDKILSLAD